RQQAESEEQAAFLTAQLADCDTQWSLGTFGAIAEFIRDLNESVLMPRDGLVISAVTSRGGLKVAVQPGLRLFASEGVTRTSWSQRVSLCLPEAHCGMSGRHVLTEVGADKDALRKEDRNFILFDLGLGALQLDACIRIVDETLASELRKCC